MYFSPRLTQALYEHSSFAVTINSKIGDFFCTTIGVRQGFLLSAVLCNLFVERIMQITPHDHVPTISIGGRPVCNIRFADDIDLMGGNNGELQDLTNKLVTSANTFEMDVSIEKSKVLVNTKQHT